MATRARWERLEHLLARRDGMSKSFQFKPGALAPVAGSWHRHVCPVLRQRGVERASRECGEGGAGGGRMTRCEICSELLIAADRVATVIVATLPIRSRQSHDEQKKRFSGRGGLHVPSARWTQLGLGKSTTVPVSLE